MLPTGTSTVRPTHDGKTAARQGKEPGSIGAQWALSSEGKGRFKGRDSDFVVQSDQGQSGLFEWECSSTAGISAWCRCATSYKTSGHQDPVAHPWHADDQVGWIPLELFHKRCQTDSDVMSTNSATSSVRPQRYLRRRRPFCLFLLEILKNI